jgi:hypothetical protein
MGTVYARKSMTGLTLAFGLTGCANAGRRPPAASADGHLPRPDDHTALCILEMKSGQETKSWKVGQCVSCGEVLGESRVWRCAECEAAAGQTVEQTGSAA